MSIESLIIFVLVTSFLFYVIGGILAYGRYKANFMRYHWDNWDEMATIIWSLGSWLSFAISVLLRNRETPGLMWRGPREDLKKRGKYYV